MVKYVLEPKAVSARCFLLQALHWVAFYKYPVEEVDILANDTAMVLDARSTDYPVSLDYEFMFTPEFCKTHNLPVHPEIEAILNHQETYLEDDFYNKVMEYELSDEEKKELSDKQCKAVGYNKRLSNFNDKLDEYLELFKAKLFVFLKDGKIKSYAFESKNKHIYDDEAKKNIGKEFFNEYYPDIKDGEVFYDDDDLWYRKKAVSIPKDYWRLDNIDWDSCKLKYKGQEYVYIQLDVADLLKCFPEPPAEYKQVKYVEGSYVLDNSKDVVIQKRGRKPKINYDELALVFVANIDEYRGQKLDSIVRDFEVKFPEVKRTSLITRLSPLWKAANNQK